MDIERKRAGVFVDYPKGHAKKRTRVDWVTDPVEYNHVPYARAVQDFESFKPQLKSHRDPESGNEPNWPTSVNNPKNAFTPYWNIRLGRGRLTEISNRLKGIDSTHQTAKQRKIGHAVNFAISALEHTDDQATEDQLEAITTQLNKMGV